GPDGAESGPDRICLESEPCRAPETGVGLWAEMVRPAFGAGRSVDLLGGTGIDLVEHTAIAEIFRLGFAPSTEVLDGHEVQLAEAGRVFGRCGFRAVGPVVVLGSNGLTDIGIEVV